MRTIVSLLVLVFASVTASAQSSAYARVDMKEGSQPYAVYSFTMPNGLQFFAFDAHNAPEWEVGKQFVARQVGAHTLSLSGYAAYRSEAGTWFAIPWLHAHGPLSALKASYAFNLATYVPFNGGPHFTFFDDSNVMWKVSERISFGVSGKFTRADDGAQNFGIGPKVSVQVSKNLKLNLRYLAMEEGMDVLRVQPILSY